MPGGDNAIKGTDMEYVYPGLIIKLLREQQGMSQEQLAAGIMDRAHLSRVENGYYNLTKDALDAIFNKLGLASKRFFPFAISDAEHHAFLVRDEFMVCMENLDVKKAFDILQYMSSNPVFQKGPHMQFLRKCKAMMIMMVDKDLDEAYDVLLAALKLSIPPFEEEHAYIFPYTALDVEIVCLMAQICYMRGEPDNAAALLSKVVQSIKKRYMDAHEAARILTFVMCKLSNFQLVQSKYDEALKTCNEAIKTGQDHHAYDMLPTLLTNKASCLYHNGDHEEAKGLLCQAYHVTMAYGLEADAKALKEYALSEYQLEI